MNFVSNKKTRQSEDQTTFTSLKSVP